MSLIVPFPMLQVSSMRRSICWNISFCAVVRRSGDHSVIFFPSALPSPSTCTKRRFSCGVIFTPVVLPSRFCRFWNMSRSANIRFSPASCSQFMRSNCSSASFISVSAPAITGTGTFEPSTLFTAWLRNSTIIGWRTFCHAYSGVMSAVCGQSASDTLRSAPPSFLYSEHSTAWALFSYVCFSVRSHFFAPISICFRISAPVSVPSKS